MCVWRFFAQHVVGVCWGALTALFGENVVEMFG